MLDAIKLVQGAVSKKDFLPVLTHFCIKNGRITGYNGALALSSPISVDLDCTPSATAFVKAVQACSTTIQMHLETNGKLCIKSGPFKARIECYTEAFPNIAPEGEPLTLSGNLVGMLKVLFPFISDDASRPWSRGILLRGNSAFATNNIVLVEHWANAAFPVELNIPRNAIAELIRIGKEPTHLQLAENSATFHYETGAWLKTQTLVTEWPDVSAMLNSEKAPVSYPAELWAALNTVKPFVNGAGEVYFRQGGLATEDTDASGADVEINGFNGFGCFNVEQLLLLEKVAEKITFEPYPKPCPFFGKMLRGVIVGMRKK